MCANHVVEAMGHADNKEKLFDLNDIRQDKQKRTSDRLNAKTTELMSGGIGAASVGNTEQLATKIIDPVNPKMLVNKALEGLDAIRVPPIGW